MLRHKEITWSDMSVAVFGVLLHIFLFAGVFILLLEAV